MAVVGVKKIDQLCTSSRTKEDKTATDVYLVLFDGPGTAIQAENASGIPALFSGHPEDSSRKVKTVTPKCVSEDSQRNAWQVQVDYSSKVDEEEDQENPLDEPDKISWDFSESTQPYFLDESDPPKPVVNTAKEPFEALLERESGSITVTVERNVASYSPTQAVEYRQCINQGGFTLDGASIGDGQAKLSGINASPYQVQNGVRYRTLRYTLKLRESWDDKVESRGFNELVDGKLRKIVRASPRGDTLPVDKPYPLAENGKSKPAPTDEPHQLTFKPYKKKSFGVFNFS